MKPRLTTERFVQKSKLIHGEKYDYSKSIYTHNSNELIIICKSHGEFKQKAIYHTSGHGCPLCSKDNNGKSSKTSVGDLFNRISVKYADTKFPNFHEEYLNYDSNITLICSSHGESKRNIKELLRAKYSCQKCQLESRADQRRSPLDKVLSQIKDAYGERYEFPLLDLEYSNSKSKLTAICKVHGEFKVVSNDIVSKSSGCPACAGHISESEIDLYEFVKSLGLNTVKKDRSLKSRFELDITLPDNKIAIEFNGVYWHSYPRKDKNYHFNKRIMCESLGYRLISIWEDEWNDNKDKIKSYLKAQLGIVSKRIFARKCSISKVPPKEAKEFLNDNHLLGYGIQCKVYYGLYYESELVSIMSFRVGMEGIWELQRAANLKDTLVVGGFSKLYSAFMKEYNPPKVLSYIDLDKFKGESYKKVGFVEISTSKTMWYVFKSRRVSRHLFKKDRLATLPNFNPELTELQNCLNMNICPAWNSGTLTISHTLHSSHIEQYTHPEYQQIFH